MIWKNMFFRLLLASFILSISIAASAADSSYDAYNITIQPGSSEAELNFTWFTYTEPTDAELIITGETGSDTTYAATCELATIETEDVSFGRPSGPPSDDEEEEDEEEVVVDEDDPFYACKVSVSGLEASSQYSYIVGDNGSYVDSASFETRDAEDYNFIFISDPQIGTSGDTESDGDGWATTVATALTKFPEASFILSAGDQVDAADSDSQYSQLLSVEELSSIPYVPCVGNHDYYSNKYAYQFNTPNESDELGTTSAGSDYWFTYGNTLFMVLNTNEDSITAHSEFLEEATSANPDVKWKIVVQHHSLYSSASHVADVNDLRTGLTAVFDDYDIDVVLGGHDHFYARSYQLAYGDIVEDGASFEDYDSRAEEYETTYVDVAGIIVGQDDQKVIGRKVAVDPEGILYLTANSASGSKYYDFTYIEGYTNVYLAKYEQLETPTFINIEVDDYTFTISAYRTDTQELLDTYSIAKTREGRHAYEEQF
jgi:hypothetical protein